MRDASQPLVPDTRLLRTARSQWFAAFVSVLAALAALALPAERALPPGGSGQPDSQATARP